jgi:hypothetical protein
MASGWQASNGEVNRFRGPRKLMAELRIQPQLMAVARWSATAGCSGRPSDGV